MIEIKIGKQGAGMSRNYFSGIEAQLADCAVCILHTYIAHKDFQNDFLRHPNEQNELLEPYVKAYLDGQDHEQRNIGNNIPDYNKLLVSFSRLILMMYVNEPDFKSEMDNISKYSDKFEKNFPDVQQARLIFAQYAKLFWKARKHKSHG